MKRILLAILLIAAMPLSFTACGTPPSARVAQVQTLKAVGHTAETAVATAAQLYRDGVITAAQAREVADFYDLKFQPAFRVAVLAVNSNLDTSAPDQLIALSSQLSALVIQLAKR